MKFIEITRADTKATHAGKLLQMVNSLRTFLDLQREIKGVMTNSQENGFAELETRFGIPLGDGAAVWKLINEWDAAAQQNFVETVG